MRQGIGSGGSALRLAQRRLSALEHTFRSDEHRISRPLHIETSSRVCNYVEKARAGQELLRSQGANRCAAVLDRYGSRLPPCGTQLFAVKLT